MRIRKVKKIAAIAMAAIMAIGSIPFSMGLTSASAATDVTKTVNFDLSGVAAVEKTDVDFMAGDVPVIANGQVSVKETTESPVTNENGVVYTKWINTGGAGNTGKRAMKLVLPTTSDVTVWALSNSADEERAWVIADADAKVVAEYNGAKLGGTVTGVTKTLSAGTYYIYALKSVNFYDIDIQWSLGFDLSGVTAVEKTDVDFTAGNVPVIANGQVSVKETTESTVTNENGVVYTKWINTGGAGNTGKRAMKIELPFSVDLTVWALSNSADEERAWVIADADAKVVAEYNGAKLGSTVTGVTTTLSAGTYYIYALKSVNFYDIVAKYAPNFDLSAYTTSTEIEAETVAGDFTLIGGTVADSKNLTADVPEGTSDDAGVAFTHRLKLNGSGSASKRAVKVTVDYKTSLNVYALSGGTDERTLNVENAEGKVVATVVAASKDNATVVPTSITLAPGTYYIYSAGKGINIYDIRLKPAKSQCAWSEVPAPVINSVTVNEGNGNFVVDFTATVDKYDGADYVVISMVSNGAEVSSTKVIGKETSIEMTPYWDGNYSFTATAVRSGEAHKASNTVEIKDFKLRLRAPAFRMFESIGGGKVYIDWVDNEYADSYEVYYKLATETDDAYKLVTTLTEGNIALSDLTVGTEYTIKVVAKSSSSGLSSAYADNITVTEKGDKVWYVATTGSNQTVNMTITTADGVVETHVLSVQDQSTDKTSWEDAVDVTNTTGKIEIAAADDGKISDDEDGFRYYYTMVNPNTENFKLTATFKITDISRTPDNQTGFGIMATDILGVNWFGDGTYVHKYYNSILMGHYSATKNSNAVLKNVTGYNSGDASNADTAERVNSLSKFNGTVSYEVGNTYTFTLEKTNEKFIGTFNGQSIDITDTSILSVQEDGSICIGVFSARKVGVEITDIKFETSESTGVTGGNKSTAVTPSTRIYSTNTVGSTSYELIYASNVAGTLVVTGPDGKIYEAVPMKADSVARVNVAVATGSNTIKTVFTPSKDAELTSYDAIESSVTVTCKQIGPASGVIYVSPAGTTDGAGTKESPMSLAEVVKYAAPGQVIIMMDGEYTKSITIPRSVCGTAGMNIVLKAENVGKAVFTGGAGLSVEGSFWHVYGINTVGAAGVGIQIYGNYNTIEMCTVQGSANSGIQISRSGSASNAQGIEGLLWPSYNLVKNCESFDNCDAGRNDADGFAAKLTCGEGNKFYGCIAHNNIDDGWDLFAKTVSGEIGAVTIENCVAYDNGWLTAEPGVYSSEGNGFKLGGGYLNGGHILKNSIAFNNRGKGITSNSCPDCEIYNCISYNNQADGGKGYNIGLNAKASAEKPWKVDGLISMNTAANTTTADLISFALQSKTNFIYDGNVSFNVDGVVAEDSWFVSTDVSKKPTRNADGTINMGGLLELTADAQAAYPGVGAILVTTGEAVSTEPMPNSIIPSGGDKNVITDVEKGDDVVIVDSEGKEVVDENIYMEIVESDAAEITKVEEALKVQGIEIKDDVKAEFFNITLKDKDGKALSMKDGKVYVTFAYPEGTNMNSHTFAVYHMEGDKLEKVSIELTAGGIKMEAKGFSPYVVVYEEVDTPTEDPVIPEEPEIPGTGDATNAMPFVVMMLLSAAVAAGYFFDKKRRAIVER